MFRIVAKQAPTRRLLSTVTAPVEGPDKYVVSLRWLHWLQAFAVIGAIGSVNYAMRRPKTEQGQKERADAMFAHKSFGAFIFFTIPIRVLVRLATKAPAPLPNPAILQFGASATHVALYLGMIFMSSTGIAMGYASGKPAPFFWTTLPVVANPPQPEDAKKLYYWHKQVGFWWQFLVPLHFGGATVHYVQGQRIFARMNPFI